MNRRVIARLDIKNDRLIKPVQFEGLRIIGDAHEYAVKYAEQGADELLLMDAVASLYGRSPLHGVLEKITDSVFIPITVGGGIRTLDDVRRMFDHGADKVAINTAAVRDPALIEQIAGKYGSQAIAVSIEAKRSGNGYEVLTDGGREHTGLAVAVWLQQAVNRGAGEVLLTGIDQDGTMLGYDRRLLQGAHASVPVVASGGARSPSDCVAAANWCDAVAIGASLHYGKFTIADVKSAMLEAGITVRPVEAA